MDRSNYVNKCGPFSLAELEKISGGKIWGANPEHPIFLVHDLATLSEAGGKELSILHQKKYIKMLEQSLAGACIIAPDYVNYAPPGMRLLVHKNPYKAFALILQAFYPPEEIEPSVAPSAFISKSAILGKGCQIEHCAYIGKNARIGDRCKIGASSYIGDGVTLGDDCLIDDNASIRNTSMGNKVLVYPGARIGQDGFGFASDDEGHYKIPHRGRVLIGNNVEIGANTCIDRGSLKDTIIEDWCRIDNLVQVGHNAKIGKGSIIAGQAGLAGSTELGEFVFLGGQVGVSAHAKIGKKAMIIAQAGVMKDVQSGVKMAGSPAVPILDWHRQTISLQRIIKNQKQ